jgi:hypothetical protein
VGTRCVSAAVGALTVLVLAGCTTPSPGEPVPATSVENTTTGSSPGNDPELPFAGAPKVDNPLDTTRFQQDPCQALTPEQVQPLGLPPTGAPRDMALGNACEWSKPGSTGSATIHFSDKDPRGLSAVYQAKEEGRNAFFEELAPIEGYPAVASDVVDSRQSGACVVVVGVSDKITFESMISLDLDNIGNTDPCEVAANVAGLALQTMKR